MATKHVVIKFFAPVSDGMINALMDAIDWEVKQGATRFIVLISSPGSSVQS